MLLMQLTFKLFYLPIIDQLLNLMLLKLLIVQMLEIFNFLLVTLNSFFMLQLLDLPFIQQLLHFLLKSLHLLAILFMLLLSRLLSC